MREVELLEAGERRTLAVEQLRFHYRRSSLRDRDAVVLAATLELCERPRAQVEAEMRRLLGARSASQPTAGRTRARSSATHPATTPAG